MAKGRAIVGLPLSPPARALVRCGDEKSQRQARARPPPGRPLRPGLPERRPPDDKRPGPPSRGAALDGAPGSVSGQCSRRPRARAGLAFLKQIDRTVPHGRALHLVLDTAAPHKTAAGKAGRARRPPGHVHCTLTSASWLNQVERWFAELPRKPWHRGGPRAPLPLATALRAVSDPPPHNETPTPGKWTNSAADIRAAGQRFCLRVEHH